MVEIEWHNGAVSAHLHAPATGPVTLTDLRTFTQPARLAPEQPTQPLVEVLGPRWGRMPSSCDTRLGGTQLGAQLRYVDHTTAVVGRRHTLEIMQEDPASGLRATSLLSAHQGVAAITSRTTLSLMPGRAPITIWAVTSFATGALLSEDVDHLAIWRGESSWAAEGRWTKRRLRSAGLKNFGPRQRGELRRHALGTTSSSTWSAGAFIPAGAGTNEASGATLAWQIEHNGAWHWEVGEDAEGAGRTAVGAYLAIFGPTDLYHHWSVVVDESRSFTTVPATIGVGSDFASAFGELAHHRRAARRPHARGDRLPVVFNDWMNTLEGSGTQANLLPLIDAAAAVGCEYFCLDAGWYQDGAPSDWWSSVGDWEPATLRFPDGLGHVTEHIRSRGLVPGLWMEPEVTGVDSKAAAELPHDAFLQRGGERLRDRGRYLLDLRHPAAVAHLDGAVDRLIADFSIGYFKFDYNLTPGVGTDRDAESPGHGLLEHNRSLLRWFDSILDRHPEVIIESCASGGLRSDFATLSRLQLQSTSDQTNPLMYPAIAVGSLVHILPEQAGNWTYPQPDMSDEMIAFCMCIGLAGRMYHAGRIDLMTDEQRTIVRAGVDAHRQTRHLLASSVPVFPTGLPSWDDSWTTVGFRTDQDTYVIAWRQSDAPTEIELALDLPSSAIGVEQVYPPTPSKTPWNVVRIDAGVRISSPAGPGARMFRIRHTSNDQTATRQDGN